MDYKRFDDTILVRMDRGEEIVEQVKAVALKEHVTLASVQALGAINDLRSACTMLRKRSITRTISRAALRLCR